MKKNKNLTALQHHVTHEGGTEPPFKNKYWDNHSPGVYVDIISGIALFCSLDKYDSGSGWPSFKKPIDENEITLQEDNSLNMRRVEVMGRKSRAHLGHVFSDGPPPLGKRFCINSASLLFIPSKDLAKKGYEKYCPLFDKKSKIKES